MEVYLVGVKGTGMASLAALLKAMGHQVAGCDVSEHFSTDALLASAQIPVDIGFSEELLAPSVDVVIHSSAYGPATPILRTAKERGVKTISYPDYVAQLSARQPSWAVAATHGKTTTVSVATHLLDSLKDPLPFYALYGGQLTDRDTVTYRGDEIGLFEACEYQDHFLSYQLSGLLILSIEWEHVDYFADLEAVMASFRALITNLATTATLIYNADDANVQQIADWARTHRPDLVVIGYGQSAKGPFQLKEDNRGTYTLDGITKSPLPLTVGQRNLVADHVGALILASCMIASHYGKDVIESMLPLIEHLGSYRGAIGRLEVMAIERSITFIDDYAHHPNEITTTLDEVRRRYPDYPILVIFSPHTASRTLALMDGFVSALGEADSLIIQTTFASARADTASKDPAYGLFDRLRVRKTNNVWLAAAEEEVVAHALGWLQERTVCITMGAGNNRMITDQIIRAMRSKA
ncbi:MAG: Mur ligase domain-containing protein [Sphaerochaeta sp.]